MSITHHRHLPFFLAILGIALSFAATAQNTSNSYPARSIKLIAPVALEEKQRFAIREGGKTVGAGVVTKIIK